MTYLPRLAGTAAVFALIAGAAQAGMKYGEAASPEVAGMAAVGEEATGTIVEAAVASDAHSTLVAAVKAADLVGTLSGPGPFTVFAPTNDAFAELPEGTVETLLEPANKDALTGVLTYHVVPAAVSASDLMGLIDANGGEAELTTVSGGKLIARKAAGGIEIIDANGNAATVTAADLDQSNGVIHVIDTVLLPG